MDERDLAGMIVKIGLARGLDADRLVDELARLALPSFLDARAFRASLVDTIEEQWRAELDARVQRLRDQLGGAVTTDGRIEAVAAGFVPSPTAAPVTQYDVADSTAIEAASGLGEESMQVPRDATQIWDARRG